MKFDTYETLFDCSKEFFHKKTNPFDFYAFVVTRPPETELDYIYNIRACVEGLWYGKKRPFYKVWPSIREHLTKTKLTIKLADLQLRRNAYAIFLPEGHGSILVFTDESVLSICVQLADKETAVAKIFPTARTIEESIEDDPKFMPMLKIAVAVIMLEHDPSVIEPEVLAADRTKWEQTHDPKYIEKAIRRGVYGWRVGERVEMCPHFRRAHFAIRWKGKGRTVPVLRPIKASIVHREVMERVPTDRLDT